MSIYKFNIRTYGGEGSGHHGHGGLEDVWGGSTSKIVKVSKAKSYLDKKELESLKDVEIKVVQLANRYATMRGNTMYIDSDVYEKEHPAFISAIMQHELMHKDLVKKGISSADQEWRVRNKMKFWLSSRKQLDADSKKALQRVSKIIG